MLTTSDLRDVVRISIELSAEKDRSRLLEKLLATAMDIADCDAGTLYLYRDDALVFRIMKTLSQGVSRGEHGEPIDLPPVALREENVCAFSAIHRELINIPDVYTSDRFDFSGPKRYDAITGYRTGSMLVVPLEDGEGVLIGVLQLLNKLEGDGFIPFTPDDEFILQSLGSMTAVSLSNVLYIDEINTAHMEFVREAIMRAEYTLATLNPDDPALPVYREYINRCRPLPEWSADTPGEILDELTEPAHPGWVHWFFTFDDNEGLDPDARRRIEASVPVGTKLWKNKIRGLRGRSMGLVFSNFDRRAHVLPTEAAHALVRRGDGARRQAEHFSIFSCGVDTAYSQKSPDTIAMAFLGITNLGRCVVLDERVYNNAALKTPLAPSDTVRRLAEFLDRNARAWGLCRTAFIDSADQATITEAAKYKRVFGSIYSFAPAWKKERIIDRINHQLGWFAPADGTPCFFMLESCPQYIRELETYSWSEDRDNEPEDGNDHMINAVQYAWLPFEKKIGIGRRHNV